MPFIRFFSLGVSRVFLTIKHTLGAASHADSQAFTEWRSLYVAALFEKDEGRMIERIAQAKKALVVRARELFLSEGNHQQEQTAIDDALRLLHMLEHCAIHPHAAH